MPEYLRMEHSEFVRLAVAEGSLIPYTSCGVSRWLSVAATVGELALGLLFFHFPYISVYPNTKMNVNKRCPVS